MSLETGAKRSRFPSLLNNLLICVLAACVDTLLGSFVNASEVVKIFQKPTLTSALYQVELFHICSFSTLKSRLHDRKKEQAAVSVSGGHKVPNLLFLEISSRGFVCLFVYFFFLFS